MKKTIHKKNKQDERKRKWHEEFLKRLKGEQKYEKFRRKILKLKEKEVEIGIGNKKNEYSTDNTTELAYKNETENKSQLSTLIEQNMIKEEPFLNCLNFIIKRLDSTNAHEYMHTYLLYCNFDICLNNNMSKHFNLPVNIAHSYYRSVILFVSQRADIWREKVINGKMRMIKKIMSYDKFEEIYYTDELMKAFTTIYDLFLFDSTIRSKRYNMLILKIKQNNRAFTTIHLNENNFIETITNAINKSYVDIKKGTSNSVPIGYLAIGPIHLYENIKTVESFMLRKYTGKNIIVTSIYLKFMDISIPLYVRGYDKSVDPKQFDNQLTYK